jgi:hypothetical protein|tara:strand:+ start:3710 stop:4276 length:567 start_codon:yes stop_codon:yes gene_type:complete
MEEIRVKTTNLTTNGDFWLLDGQSYSGNYHIWTDGKAMTGSRFNGGKSKELKMSPNARNIVEYDLLTEKAQRGGQYAIQERPLPTKSDYENGSFMRHFVKKSSDINSTIFEVESTTIGKLKYGYYSDISLKWKLTGPIVDKLDRDGNRVHSGVKQTNQRTIKKMNAKMSGLKWRLTNYLEYYIPDKNK